MGSGVIRIVGTGGIVDNFTFVTVLGSVLGTRFVDLGSGLWNMEKTKSKRDRLKPPQSPHEPVRSSKKDDDNVIMIVLWPKGDTVYLGNKPNKAK